MDGETTLWWVERVAWGDQDTETSCGVDNNNDDDDSDHINSKTIGFNMCTACPEQDFLGQF